jgi:Methyltransferase domain
MGPHTFYQFAKKFRQNRMKLFLEKFTLTPQTTILDVGGFSGFWMDAAISSKITILRPEGPEKLPDQCPPNITSIQGDGCDLRQHADKSFDLVFSNSVIEHVGGIEKQRMFANEALRIGRGVWMQTPAAEFPVEPHLLTPFYHWLPRSWQERFYPWTLWGLLSKKRPTFEDYQAHVQAYLLSRKAITELFPETEVITERFLGMPKSYIATIPFASKEAV